jgi:urease accessory protein
MAITTDQALLVLLQFADGLFPAGGFAHSFGLETYVQEGRVTDRRGLEAFMAAHLEGSSGPADAVAVALAARRAAADDGPGCGDIDQRLDAMKVVPEFRAASRQMGRQTLRVASALAADPWLAALGEDVAADRLPGHHAVVFGAVLGRGGIGPEVAAAAYLHSTSALLVGAGLRLIAMGQVEGQRALAAMRPRIGQLAAAAARASLDDMWSFTPGIEIAGIKHATLDRRLFRS